MEFWLLSFWGVAFFFDFSYLVPREIKRSKPDVLAENQIVLEQGVAHKQTAGVAL